MVGIVVRWIVLAARLPERGCGVLSGSAGPPGLIRALTAELFALLLRWIARKRENGYSILMLRSSYITRQGLGNAPSFYP